MSNFRIFPADVALEHSESALGSFIRWFEREPNEPAVVNHAMLGAYNNHVTEALRKVTLTPWEEYERAILSRESKVIVFRHQNLNLAERNFIAGIPFQWLGQSYGIGRLFRIGLDKLCTETLGLDPNLAKLPCGHSVCSSLVARSYIHYYEKWGDWRDVTPDDICDICLTDQATWDVAYASPGFLKHVIERQRMRRLAGNEKLCFV